MKKTILLILGFLFLTSLVFGQNAYKIYINEIRADDEGVDDICFVELIGPAGTDITNFEILHYNQTTTYQWTRTISSFSIPDDGITDSEGNSIGFFVLSYNTSVANYDQVDTFNPQNGPGDFLVLKDDSGNILDAVAWGSPTTNFITIGLTQSGTTTANNYLHSTLNDNASDTSLQAPDNVLGDNGSSWILADATPGTINSGQTSGNIILPVTLSSFTAQFINSTPTLYWTTQSETNNSCWNIYRSISQNIGQAILVNDGDIIIGAGTSTEPTDYIYVDENGVIENTTYWYWIESVDYSGETENYGPVSLTIPSEGNNIPEIPIVTGLHQNFPNPFNPSTLISFNIKEHETGILTVYNIKRQLIVEDEFGAGSHNFSWDAGNYSSGVYFYKLQTESYTKIMKMLMVK